MRKFLGHITSAMNVYRNGGKVFFDFKTDGMEHQPQEHLTALASAVPNATNMKRKKSCREQRARKFQRKGYASSQLSQEEDDDDDHLPPPNARTKSCSLCKQDGHSCGHCPKIIKFRTPLPRNDEKVRQDLVCCLKSDGIYRTELIECILSGDELDKFPKYLNGIILNEKCKVENEDGFRLRCSLMMEKGDIPDIYRRKLFPSEVVFKWMLNSKSNLIINQIAYNVNEEE